MKLRDVSLCLFGIVGLSATQADAALQWTGENIADANTIALYHFNENTGSVSASEVAGRPNINLTASNLWSSDVGWLTSPSGSSLNNVNGTNNGKAQTEMGVTAAEQQINWGLPGITISFWMKDAIAVQEESAAVYLGHDGWRDQQAWFGYRPGFSNGARLATDGVAQGTGGQSPWNWTQVTDGQWHHIGLVFDNSTDTARLYVDNVLQQLGTDGGGNPVYSWSTAGGWTGTVTELMHIGDFAGNLDELLIQGEVMTDFSNALNVPEPSSIGLLGLAGVAMARRHRRA